MTGAEHAALAASQLARIEAQEEELDRIRAEEPERHLELAAAGALGSMSRDRQWTAELAIAHALVAIAEAMNR